jgi:two-component system, OmpR family, sensor histidine kinase KdpD
LQVMEVPSKAIVSSAEPPQVGSRPIPPPIFRRATALAVRIFLALASVAALTLLLFRLMHVNATTAGFFYLLAILFIATKGGIVESTVASVAAMFSFNFYFLPPVGTLTIADPQNWVALFTFLVTSLTASQLSARAKRRAQEAIDRQSEMERLYSLSRALLLADATQPMANQIVKQIALAFEFSSVALYVRASGEVFRAGFSGIHDLDLKMREAAVRSSVVRDDLAGLVVTPIRLGGEPIGSLAVSSGALSDAALQSLLNLVAIGLERAHSQSAVNRAEVARQSEELKSTLLDAIAHEFKTPLTSIKAVTTDLLSESAGDLRQQNRELISIADEAADRLSILVTDAIQLARIEGGTFRLNLGVHFVGSLVSGGIRRVKALMDDRAIDVVIPEDIPLVRVDAELIQMAIAHLLHNALKYSPRDSAISISARTDGEKVIIKVRDNGPGISEEEQSNIFEKFYRGKNERHLKGTGMGLSIAREIVRAHGEEIGVTSKPGQGSEFFFSLPVAPRGN